MSLANITRVKYATWETEGSVCSDCGGGIVAAERRARGLGTACFLDTGTFGGYSG